MAQFAPTVPRIDGTVFLVIGWDAPGSAAIRDRELDGHLTWIEQRVDDYLVCGPLKGEDGGDLIGSYFLVNAETAAAARALVEGDPYVANGVYDELRVVEAVVAGGRFQGGVIWESAAAIRARSG